MDDANSLQLKRKSALIINSLPIYLKSKNVVIFAADKAIHVFDCTKRCLLFLLTGHSDTVTKLKLSENELISSGLDGNLITWDLETGRVLRKRNLHASISNFFRLPGSSTVVVLHEKSTRKWITLYNSDLQESKKIVDNFKSQEVYVATNEQLIASTCGTDLTIHWPKFGKNICYKFPLQGSTEKSKRFTSIACHPTEAIVATGNEIGEIMIWWNFTTCTLNAFDKIESPNVDDDDDDEEDSDGSTGFSSANECVRQFQSRGETCEWKLLHPNKVKRSVMHWHSTRVTATSFTAEGKHLYSGGLEGVLVKWDLTECFGGARNRRFFSLLGSPVCEIGAPGAESEETVVVTLEKNAFFVLNGALKVIFQEDGLGQIPSRWRHYLPSLSKAPIGILPLRLPSPTSAKADRPSSSTVLLNSSMGELQILDCDSGHVVNKFNVNRKPYVMCDRLTTPLFSDALLAAVKSNQSSQWLVLYDELQIPTETDPAIFGHSVDNQARLTWWQYISSSDQTDVSSQFMPIFSECLAYLNCPATDLLLTNVSTESLTVLLLKDLRLLVWQCNEKSDFRNSHKPWLLASCIALDTNLLYGSLNPSAQSLPAYLLHVFSHFPRQKSTRHRPPSIDSKTDSSQPMNVRADFFIYASGTKIHACKWNRWRPNETAVLAIDEVSPLTNSDLSESDEWGRKFSRENRRAPVVTYLSRLSASDNIFFIVGLLRDHNLPSSKIPPSGGVCLMELVSEKGKSCHLDIIKSDYTLTPTAIACHNSLSLFTVGQLDGSCTIFRVEKRNFTVMHTFAKVPSFPFCDRQQFKRRNRNKRSRMDSSDTNDGSNSLIASQPHAICFLDTVAEVGETEKSSLRLAAIFTTMLGREHGRRDLLVYDPPLKKSDRKDFHDSKVSDLKECILKREASKGILQFTDPLMDIPSDESQDIIQPGYKLEVTKELESVLRQVSQYPVHSAPPPEQLLAQLFKKPNL